MRQRSLQATLVLPQGTATVSGDEVRTQQVLVNVLANALDAVSYTHLDVYKRQIQHSEILDWPPEIPDSRCILK